MKKPEIAVTIALLGLVMYTLALSALGTVQTNRTISNAGTVKAIGVGVYSDSECNSPLSSIDWGTLEPGANQSVTCYIRNEGNSASVLSVETSNWSPPSVSDYMTFGWDYAGQPLSPGEVVEVTFTLAVSPSIDGITSFSFDVVIVGSG
jgi:hypothetical protein